MDVEIKLMRSQGRRVPSTEDPKVLRGELMGTPKRIQLFKFGQSHVGNAVPLAQLYAVEVLSLGSGSMYLRGYEEERGAAVLQEWDCRLTSLQPGEGLNFHGQSQLHR